MKLKPLIILLMLYCFCTMSFAESDIQPIPKTNKKDKQLTENENNTSDTEAPIPPLTPRAPNFSLQGLKPVNSAPLAHLQLTSAVLTNSDLADTSLGSSAATSTVFFNGASLSAMPKLGESTWLSANINGGFIRYDGEEVNDYDTLNANLGLFQQLGDSMSGELGWRYSQYYVTENIPSILDSNPHDLQEQGVRLALNRIDRLPLDFFWTNNYEFQANFSDPVDRTRLSHYFTSGLGYDFTNKLQATVFYRLKHDDFLNRAVNDDASRHEFQAQLSYQITKYINLAGTVSYLFGDTIDLLRNPLLVNNSSINTQDASDLGNLSFGFRIRANVPLLNS